MSSLATQVLSAVLHVGAPTVREALLAAAFGECDIAAQLGPDATPSGRDAVPLRLAHVLRQGVEPRLFDHRRLDPSAFEEVLDAPMVALGEQVAAGRAHAHELFAERQPLVEVLDVRERGMASHQRGQQHVLIAQPPGHRKRRGAEAGSAVALIGRERDILREPAQEQRPARAVVLAERGQRRLE